MNDKTGRSQIIRCQLPMKEQQEKMMRQGEIVFISSRAGVKERALTKDLSYLERIGEMVENALNEAKENMKMAHKDLFASAKENNHVQDYLEDMEEATSAEDREAYVNGLLYSLFIEAELEWMKRNYTDDMDMDAVFRKFRDALVSYAKKEKTLAKAVEAAGFDVPDSKYNAALAYAARQALEAMNKGMEDVKYSLKENVVEEGMDDLDRANTIRNQTVELEDAKQFVRIDEIRRFTEMKRYSDAEKSLVPIAREYELIPNEGRTEEGTELVNKYLPYTVKFSRRSLHESLQKQKSTYGNMRALLPVLREAYENAVPVLVQGDRYLYTVNDESLVESFAYLLGGFRYGESIIPVQFEVKKKEGNMNNLYIVATIKEDTIIGGGQGKKPPTSAPPVSSEIKITELIKLVNTEDNEILANLPYFLLSEEQRAAKQKGLEEKGEYLQRKARERGTYKNGIFNMTKERIDAAIQEYGAKYNENYSKAYMAYITPADFLSLTTANIERIQQESRVMVADEIRNIRQTPFIRYDQETCEVTGHEGRHRMVAMMNAGVEKVAILFIPGGSEGRSNRQSIESMTLKGQEFGKGKAQGEAAVNDLVPVNEAHREELYAKFSDSESWVKYSMKDTGGTDGKDLNEAIGEEARKKRAEEREYEIEALTGGSIEDMREELEESNKAYQLLKEMHKLSLDKRGTAFWNKKIDKIARKLKERYATKYSLSEMKKDLALLFKAMDDRDYNIKEILSFANDIAHEITKKAIREDVRDERVIDAYKAIRGSVIYLDKHDAENIRGIYGSIRNFNRSHFGLLSLTTKKSYYRDG